MKKRIVCAILAAVMLLSLLAGLTFRADAAINANVQKKQTQRTISVVFDNSGSMYMGTPAWCQATYAMEVFAAMLNEGDVLQIHPMNPCYLRESNGQISGKSYVYGSNPLIINGPEDANLIRKLYIDTNGGTPIESIKPAYEALKKAGGDEKWLIVLSDGQEFHLGNSGLGSESGEYLTNTLNDCTGVNIMFLGIGSNAAMPTGNNDLDRIYRKANNSSDVLSYLTQMCNIIFDRDEIKNVTNQISTEVSMSKLIIFAQGGNVSNVSVDAGKRVNMVQMHYSEIGIANDVPGCGNMVDSSLQGVLVTYENVPKGTHPLQIDGSASSINVYYEPGVDLQVELQDEQGNPVDPNSELPPGKYYIDYALYDTVTGERITDTTLLGKVQYDIVPLINGQEAPGYSGSSDGRVELDLKDGDTLNGKFNVTFLEDYSISKDGQDFNWPAGGVKIVVPPAGALVLTPSGGKDTYNLLDLEEQAVYHFTVTYDGAQLTGAELSDVSFNVTLTGGNACYDIQKTEDGFDVFVKYNGSAADTQPGAYTLTAEASYVNPDGLTAVAPKVTKKFDLEDNSGSLGVKVSVEQDFYALTSMDDAKPVYIYITYNGAPLDAEKFSQTQVKVQLDTLNLTEHYTLEEDAANSRYILRLVDSDALKTGSHTVNVTATGTDELGREITAKGKGEFEIQPYPLWLRILFWILVILAILGLIWAYMIMKVLPKRIDIDRCVFRVGNKEVSGEAECNYGGGGKKRGYLEINPPYFGGAPSASSCGISLELVAVSPRRTPSSKRFVGIRGATAGNDGGTDRMKFGGTTLVKNTEGTFVRMGTTTDTIIEDDVDSGFPICVYASVPGPRGRKVSVSLDVRTQFY